MSESMECPICHEGELEILESLDDPTERALYCFLCDYVEYVDYPGDGQGWDDDHGVD